MDQQPPNTAVKEDANINLSIIKFCQNLGSQLHNQNLMLKESCTKNNEQIVELNSEIKELFEMLWIADKRNINCDEGKVYVYHLTKTNMIWKNSLQHGLKQISQGVLRHREYCNEWKLSVQQKLQIPNDDFTMMSFHDVEREVNKVHDEIHAIQTATAQIISQTEDVHRSLESQYKDILEEISLIEPYQEEIKNEKLKLQQKLLEIKRQHQLEAFSSYSDGKQLEELQSEVEILQKQLEDLKPKLIT